MFAPGLQSTTLSTLLKLVLFSFFKATRRELTVKRRYSEFKKFPLNKRPTNLRHVLPDISEPKRELNFTIADGLAWKVTK